MKKTCLFNSFDEFEKWAELCDTDDYMYTPTAVDNGWKISVDLSTNCKRWKTALSRFRKAFFFVNKEIPAWIDTMEESCSNGCFKDINGWKPANINDPDEINEIAKNGTLEYIWCICRLQQKR